MAYKTDNESLNKLVDIVNRIAPVLSNDVVRELQGIYIELLEEYILFEKEVEFNEQLLMENEKLKQELRKVTEAI